MKSASMMKKMFALRAVLDGAIAAPWFMIAAGLAVLLVWGALRPV